MTTEQLKPWAYKPQERAAAKAAGETTYFTGRPCSKGHVVARATASGSCHECSLVYQKESRLNNLAARKEKDKLKYSNNRQKMIATAKTYRDLNPIKVIESNKKWREAHKHVKAFSEQLRNASKKNATPNWLSKNELSLILDFYTVAQEQKELFGVAVSVDHIVPLKGKTVCGLHVPWNLCLRTQSDNSRKSNKLLDDVYWPHKAGILICESALPWNLKKEMKNDKL